MIKLHDLQLNRQNNIYFNRPRAATKKVCTFLHSLRKHSIKKFSNIFEKSKKPFFNSKSQDYSRIVP